MCYPNAEVLPTEAFRVLAVHGDSIPAASLISYHIPLPAEAGTLQYLSLGAFQEAPLQKVFKIASTFPLTYSNF